MEDPETETIGEGQVAVPSHFFKVALILQGTHRQTLAAIVPNNPLPRSAYPSVLTTIEHVQRRTGLHFFQRAESIEPEARP